jgi:CubicO group peptidase (beta-lactamase class C family)
LPAPYKYSNAGIGLLSYLVATATGKTWEDQVNSEILQSLGMADKTLRPTPEQQKRLAQGHNRAGQDAPRWPSTPGTLPTDYARQHTHDQLWRGHLGHNEVNRRPVSAELIAAMQLGHKPIYTIRNGPDKQAMAWVNDMGGGNANLRRVIMKTEERQDSAR